MGTLTRATKNLTRRKIRATIVIAALSLALTMLIILPPSIQASQAITQRSIDILTANADLVKSTINLAATEIDCKLGTNFSFTDWMNGDRNETTFIQYKTVNITDYAGLKTIPDVATVIPILDQNLEQLKYGPVHGVPLDNAALLADYPSLLPANITDGRNLQAGDSGVVVVQEQLAKVYDVAVGSTLTLLGRNFQIVGIEGQEALNSTDVTMSLADVQALTNTAGQASGFKVFANSIDNVNTVTTRIANEYPDLQVTAGLSQLNSAQQIQDSINKQIETAQTNLNQIQNTGLTEIAIAVVADTAIILFIMLYSVRERTREIGTLKAIGASNTKILGQFMLEGAILSVIAVVVAIVIGVFAASTLANLLLPHAVEGVSTGPGSFISIGVNPYGYTGVSVAITPEIMLTGLGAAVLLGMLGSLYPALKAARTRPAEAMRYE
jgi:ABC-type antimicrobial peptide transport system permease subunit